VIGYVPAGVAVVVAMLRFEIPEPATDAGSKLAVAPAGNPVAVNATAPLKELRGEMVVATFAPHPAETVAGVAEMAKSGDVVAAVTIRFTTVVCTSPPDVAEIVIG
jgi:hypothetical protein